MTALLAAVAAVAVAGGTPLFGWGAAPLAGAALGLAEAKRKRRGPPSALIVAARGAVAGAAGWAFLLLWRGLEAPVWDVAGLIGSVAGGLPKGLVVVFALALPALVAGTAAGAAAAVSSAARGAAESRRRDR